MEQHEDAFIDNTREGRSADSHTPADTEWETEASRRFDEYLDAVGRPELKDVITSKRPWVYWTMEMYGNGLKGDGGLGMLGGDTRHVLEKLGMPAVFVTPFYPVERRQVFENLKETTALVPVTPEQCGYAKRGETSIDTHIGGNIVPTRLDIYGKTTGSVETLTVTEPNFGELYKQENNSDGRLYQEVVLGFGGFKSIRALGIMEDPAMNQQLNEAPTIFSALARLDEKLDFGIAFSEAFALIKEKTIYTNHTLVQAVEAEFSLDQFERFVFPNIRHAVIVDWLREKIQGRGGRIRLSVLAIELSGKRNGVSKIHAREAGKVYRNYNDEPVEFDAVTNGIAMERWADAEMLQLLQQGGVLDKFNLPAADFAARIDSLDSAALGRIKAFGRERLRTMLLERKNQYGSPVELPNDARVFNWKRRMAEYKRPYMVFDRPEELADILERQNGYLILAGKAHRADTNMQNEIARILRIIDGHPVLKRRVHFVENYDEILAKSLAQGSDVALNTPRTKDGDGRRISTEACGTSWEKDVLGCTVLISKSDGGPADVELAAGSDKSFIPPYLEITGNTYADEVESLYGNMRRSGDILDDPEKTDRQIKNQLAGFLPIISGSRMAADYLNLAFPGKKKS